MTWKVVQLSSIALITDPKSGVLDTKANKQSMFPRSIPDIAIYRPHRLSEIPEASGSSRATLLKKSSFGFVDGMQEIGRPRKHNSPGDVDQSAPADDGHHKGLQSLHTRRPSSAQTDHESRAPSAMSLPLREIPKRRSSISILNQFDHDSRRDRRQHAATTSETSSGIIPTRVRAESPIRHAFEACAQSSEGQRQPPTRTFIRTTTPTDLFDGGETRHSRLEMFLRLQSPLFVGGGTVEGQVELRIDMQSSKKARMQPLLISTLSVDVVGVEEVEDSGRRIFLSLATELFNRQCPPPSVLVVSQTPERGSELYWQAKPATLTIPFCINLPLKLGPPPYSSRKATIRYLLSPSIILKLGEKRFTIRQMWNIQMLTVHDPEKALANLPSPLVATDVLTLALAPSLQTVKLTAGLHRQTWVNGGLIFVDIHIDNSTDRILKKIEIQLQKSILWFTHSAAATAEKKANNLRLPKKVETETISKNVIKKCKEWEGVCSQSSETRTCEIDIPKGHVTVGECRFFEVRYFIKIVAAVTRSKSIAVQLPVTIIHINSLDVVPNSLAQVAASVAAKRSQIPLTRSNYTKHSPYTQGQAFSVARQRVHDRGGLASENQRLAEIEALTRDFDESPRRAANLYEVDSHPPTAMIPGAGNENIREQRISCRKHSMLRPSCYHCHLLYTEQALRAGQQTGLRLPRLQVSTSGLGFSETEFELPPDTPRKVMLSEQERRMINQQRELRLQRNWTQRNHHRSSSMKSNDKSDGAYPATWKNVAMTPKPGRQRSRTHPNIQRLPDNVRHDQIGALRTSHQNLHRIPVQRRSRSMTCPEQLKPHPPGLNRAKSGMRRPGRVMRSIDYSHGPLRTSISQGERHVLFPSRPSSIQSESLSVQQKAAKQRV